ncbi:MAG: type VI secretion system baseplate subunit TssE [Chthoniobacter sp.]
MSVSSAIERIQPCLFEKLVDFEPEQRQESRMEKVLSLNRYREGVVRDLEWLLNSSAHLESEELAEFPHVESSVFNYGRRDLAGLVVRNLKPGDLEDEIARAIIRFEPRLVPDTLKVTCITAEGSKSARRIPTRGTFNCLTFEITGELWAHPVSEEFFLKTTLDLESGGQPM